MASIPVESISWGLDFSSTRYELLDAAGSAKKFRSGPVLQAEKGRKAARNLTWPNMIGSCSEPDFFFLWRSCLS
jgi:hypothetical protein